MMSDEDRDDMVSRLSSILAREVEKEDAAYTNLPKSDISARAMSLGRLEALRTVKAKIESGLWI